MLISTQKEPGFVADTPVARSPITAVAPQAVSFGWQVSTKRTRAALRLSDLTPLTKIAVKASAPPFEFGYGRSERRDEWLIVGSGPGEWTLLGPPGATRHVATTGFATVIDITHGRALMRLTGKAAPNVLAKLCSIDLSEPMCPHGAAFRASVANVVTDVIRFDLDGTRSFLLHCERSSGQYLFDALADAGREFGLDTDGFHWSLD